MTRSGASRLLDKASYEVESAHQFHNNLCTCGYKSSARARDRTEHITMQIDLALGWILRPMTEQTVFTCDWGDCDRLCICERRSKGTVWLGVCDIHAARMNRFGIS